VRADNSHHLRAAARQRALATRERAVRALRRLDATGRPVTIDTVTREASVSRSWLYSQADLRAEIERLRTFHGRAPISPPVPARQRASDASLRRRLEAVNAEICRLREENQRLREQLAWAHGERRAASIHAPAGQGGALTHGRPEAIGPCS
jgi:Family of unknown function (DUF6262)